MKQPTKYLSQSPFMTFCWSCLTCRRVVHVVQLVSRHSCVADRLPVVDRFPAGPRVRLKTVDPPKGNGLGQKKESCWTCRQNTHHDMYVIPGLRKPGQFPKSTSMPGLVGVQKANVFTAPKMRLLQWSFCQNWRSFNKQRALASPTERQDPGERLLIEGLIAPPGAKEHVANAPCCLELFGSLAQAFTAC